MSGRRETQWNRYSTSAGPSDQLLGRCCVVSNKSAFLRLIFATCAIFLSLALSLRPIPPGDSINDTGRYVANQIQACALPFSGSSAVNHDSSIVIHSYFANLQAAGDPSLN